MTDNTIPLPDAIRAYRDRPSMERELQELREKLKLQERKEEVAIMSHNVGRTRVMLEALVKQHPNANITIHDCVVENELRELRAENARLIVQHAIFLQEWKDDTTELEYLAQGVEQMGAERNALRAKCERLEAALKAGLACDVGNYVESFNNDIMICPQCVTRNNIARAALNEKGEA